MRHSVWSTVLTSRISCSSRRERQHHHVSTMSAPPRQHHASTMSAPCQHPVSTMPALCQHHVSTMSAPYQHPVSTTTSAPCQHYVSTISAPRQHHVSTIPPPRQHGDGKAKARSAVRASAAAVLCMMLGRLCATRARCRGRHGYWLAGEARTNTPKAVAYHELTVMIGHITVGS